MRTAVSAACGVQPSPPPPPSVPDHLPQPKQRTRCRTYREGNEVITRCQNEQVAPGPALSAHLSAPCAHSATAVSPTTQEVNATRKGGVRCLDADRELPTAPRSGDLCSRLMNHGKFPRMFFVALLAASGCGGSTASDASAANA